MKKIAAVFLLLIAIPCCVYGQEDKPLTWEQLRQRFVCPEWFREAKFGIWTHWGAQSQPAMGGGWYARHMYMQDVGTEKWGANAYPYQCKTYGHPSEKGFKDVIHEWKAEKLDTDALMVYFKSIGAKYFVALANHHDNFDNFASTYQPWNSVNVGPKRDIIGEFAQSARKYHIPFGASSHDDRFMTWWLPAFGSDTTGPKKGIPYDGRLTKADGKGTWWEGLDPADLYGLPPEKRTPQWVESVKKNYELRLTELVTKYKPDMLWFDGYGFPYKNYGKEVCRTLYNQSLQEHGKIEAVVVGKIPGEPAVIKDIERGAATEILPQPWQGTLTFTEWFYKTDIPRRHNARTVIEIMSDIISKNGNLLLNVELLPDGTIPPDHKAELDEVGTWVNMNGDAIFATKPWKVFGDNLHSTQKSLEGSAIGNADLDAAKKQKKSENFNERTINSPPYEHDEVRFTTKGNRLFIFVLNPADGDITLPSLGLNSPQNPKAITSIRLIGSTSPVTFEQKADALVLNVPANRPTNHAAVFEVTGSL